MKTAFAAVFSLLTFLFCVNSYAEPFSPDYIYRAVAKISISGAAGTATVINEDAENYLLLSNYHITTGTKDCSLEFIKGGYLSRKLPGKVIWSAYKKNGDIDLILVTVKKSLFGEHKPTIIPIAPEGYRVQNGHYICSAGWPRAEHLFYWQGHVTSANDDGKVMFLPMSIGGQSGSLILGLIRAPDGQMYTRGVAILTWSVSGLGAAQPIDNLYKALRGEYVSKPIPASWKELKFPTGGLEEIPFFAPKSETSNQPTTTKVGQPTGKYALGSDNRLYPIQVDSQGFEFVNTPYGVTIKDWNYSSKQNGPIWPFNGGGGNQPPQPPNDGGNPYGNVNPPDIGGEWPPTNPAQPPITPPVITPPQGQVPEQPGLTPPVTQKPTDDSAWTSWIPSFTGFGGGLLTGGAMGLLVLVWNKFLRQKLIKRVDTLQDLIEKRVSQKWGPTFGKEAREAMEGVEDVLLGFVDVFLRTVATEKEVKKTAFKTELRDKIKNGNGNGNGNHTADEVMAAMKEAARLVGDDTVTTEVPRKVEEILKSMKSAQK